jgi:hypothetical protein
MEQIDLTAPVVVPERQTTGYWVGRLDLDVQHETFTLLVCGTQGEMVGCVRTGAVAVALMRQLNTANGQTKSLQRRALEWLLTQPEAQAAGITGTISGTPD